MPFWGAFTSDLDQSVGPRAVLSYRSARRIKESSAPVEALSPHTIFILDDDDVVRDSLKVLLETRNFVVVDFDSGSELLDHLATADCLVLDLHMPEMTGAELIGKLRGRGDKTPAILITGRPDKVAQAEAQALGVPLLEKPVSPKLLLDAINAALRRH